ncbi:MAG TPA: PDZ domain-containing protein [Spirochaetota bacterium]|nr:PDZ domain-containing protein [Spirochaetota bacterium]HQO02190.1 PDZ domain-containing protein [Spirochaetota bacterium]HQP48255.1 PDZ domain-containing protein [Spirochaetota bacterium]
MKNTGRLCAAVLLSAIIVISSGCSRHEFGGLGVEVATGSGVVTDENPYKIVSVYEGGTGQKAGLKKDDIIVSIDGKKINGMQHSYIVNNLLRGEVGSLILLEIQRGDKKVIYTMQRGKIVLTD